jgi:hypothetical protein
MSARRIASVSHQSFGDRFWGPLAAALVKSHRLNTMISSTGRLTDNSEVIEHALTNREHFSGERLPRLGPASLFGRWLRTRKTAFQEFDLPVVVGFVFGDMKPFGVVVC